MSDYSSIFKIWGIRKRILLTTTSEIDLLYLRERSFCSTHTHKNKINKFVIIKGRVTIETPYGNTLLKEGEMFEVRPPLEHRFFAETESIMVELAYVEKGKINLKDINRKKQGGRVIDGKEMTEDEMRSKKLIGLNNE